MKLTTNCKYCHKTFELNIFRKLFLPKDYCSGSCSFLSKRQIGKVSECSRCRYPFNHNGEKIVCGYCNDKYISELNLNENNPDYQPKIKNTCFFCGLDFEYSGVRSFCSLACMHKIKNTCSGCMPVKKQTKCLLCKNEAVDSLCVDCEELKKKDEVFWTIVLNGLKSGSKIVKKPWGLEIHIVNHSDYCLKYLVFFKDKQFSYHVHNVKKELWHCVIGSFECVLGVKNIVSYSTFKTGDKIEIERGVIHQLQAKENSILVEVSTQDFPEDSIRLINGVN